MSILDNPLRKRVIQAAKEMELKSGRQALGSRVHDLTTKVIGNWGALVPSSNGAFGLESLSEVTVKRNEGFDALVDGDPRELMQGLRELGLSSRHIESVALECLTIFDGGRKATVDSLVRSNYDAQGQVAPMSRVVGRTAAASVLGDNGGVGIEAFGDDINRLSTDDRLTMDLVIMRPWDNIMDKGLARVSESSPVVTIRVPSPEAWDWANTQQANSTAATRFSNTYKLRDLYRNPTPVNSAAKKIVAIPANDSKSVLFGDAAHLFYKPNVEVSLLDLSRNTAVIGYDQVDRTDLIADGGILDGILVSLTNPNGGTPITEVFKVNTRPLDRAMFVISPNNKASGQRQVILDCILPITSATTQYNGSASTIAAAFTTAKIQASIRITATLDIQRGLMQAGGSVQLALLPLASGAVISGGNTTLFGNLTCALAGYSADLYFDEENQRKANMAVWVNYYELQFVVPRSRIYFTEYALTQDLDNNAVEATSSVVALGNGRRGLDIIVNALNDVADSLTVAAANPEFALVNDLDEQSFAASLVKPTVVTTSIDFDTETINNMNESTKLTEIHGRFRARFLAMCTELMAKSLMLNQYKGGERPVIKAWVHSTIADLVIGITDYHPDLKDAASIAAGADYSMVLPNGYRLDVIKSNFDCLQQRIYAVPVIESDMSSIISAASIRDCGTVTTNYTPTNRGSVTRRVATTTREIVMMSNKVGMCLEIKGLQGQVGNIGYAKLALNTDSSDSLLI